MNIRSILATCILAMVMGLGAACGSPQEDQQEMPGRPGENPNGYEQPGNSQQPQDPTQDPTQQPGQDQAPQAPGN